MIVPAHVIDCHVHVFDCVRFPFAADASYRPLPCECGTADDLAAVLDAHGIARALVVTPTSGYGDDNACTLDALARLGPRARGIARVPVSIVPSKLDALAERGVVGVRIDFVALGLAPLVDPAFPRLLNALAERDLVLDVQAQGEQWDAIAPVLARSSTRVAIDHMGRPQPARGVDAPAFHAMLALAQTGRVAVKLSGADRFSCLAPPHADVLPFAAALVREFTPERLVWGSDWPFVRSARRMDYGPTLRFLEHLVADEASRQQIHCTTPSAWFKFGS